MYFSFEKATEKHNTQFCLQLKPLFMQVSRDGPDFTDEPTGNLDSKNSQEIMELLKLSNRKFGQTLIMITHDESLALQADRIIAIEDGRIARDEVIRR